MNLDQLSDQLRNGRLNDGYQVSNKNYQLALKDLSILKNQIDAVFDIKRIRIYRITNI